MNEDQALLGLTEPSRAELYKALAVAQGQIKAADVNQEMTSDAYSFKYADLAACLAVVREPLSTNGLSLIQLPSLGQDNKVTITTILAHESGESIEATMSMTPERGGPQAVGAVMTYLRRYMLCALVGVSQYDDGAASATKTADEYDRLTPRDIDELLVKADELFSDKADEVLAQMVDKVFGKKHLADIPADQLKAALKGLANKAKRDAKKAKDKAKSPVSTLAEKQQADAALIPHREPGQEG